MSWFLKSHRTRTRPTDEPVRVLPGDVTIAAWHGLTVAEWADMSTLARVDHREEFHRAHGLAS